MTKCVQEIHSLKANNLNYEELRLQTKNVGRPTPALFL